MKLRKILLIDDDDVTCYLNKLLLDRMSVAREVVSLTDAWQAFKFILDNYHKQSIPEEDGYDLIFLDINMPGMDGFAILEDMESLEIDRSRIFVVMLTSSISPADRAKAVSLGDKLQGYLIKPLRREDVEKIVPALIDKP
ncbi:response regulator [Cesiribacter sp. SM1]|uniref:response regulator n=1 Tax=Cesiribacter sp. SM1 TaxID=2861196 RepID=UPI001CD7F863|nr:response regulator [Cesiribacter sp. SM1]